MVKQVSDFDGKNADDVLEWSSKLRVSLSLYSKLIEIVQGSKRSSNLANDQATARGGWDDAIIICTASYTSRHPAQLSLSCGGLREKQERTE